MNRNAVLRLTAFFQMLSLCDIHCVMNFQLKNYFLRDLVTGIGFFFLKYCSWTMIWNCVVCLLSSFTAAIFELLSLKYQLEKKWIWTPLCHHGITSQTLNVCTLLRFFSFSFLIAPMEKVQICLLYDNENKKKSSREAKHKKMEISQYALEFDN